MSTSDPLRLPSESLTRLGKYAAARAVPSPRDCAHLLTFLTFYARSAPCSKLNNYADRDHSISYMTAVPLIFGELNPDHYSDEFAASNPLIDEIRSKTFVTEVKEYSAGYLDPERRSIANDVEVEFNDGTKLREAIEYPRGHARRREEAKPLIKAKLEKHLKDQGWSSAEEKAVVDLLNDHEKVSKMSVNDFVDLWKPSSLVQ